MVAVILAAGVGSRLFPYTRLQPKCLVKVNNKSILEYQIEALESCNIRKVIIVIGHFGDKIIEFVSQVKTTVKFSFIENSMYKDTNSSYSLWLTRDFIKDGFIYLNSDLIFNWELLDVLIKSSYQNSIIIDHNHYASDDMFKANMCGDQILEMQKDLKLSNSIAVVTGPAKFSKEFSCQLIEHLDNLINKGKTNHWCYSVFSDMASIYPFYGVENIDYKCIEVDTLEDLKRAEKEISVKNIKLD